MQDKFVGDIGDYGKYGLLRKVHDAGLALAVNWYRVQSESKNGQDDGKYIHYLIEPEKYREYDAELFDGLRKIVIDDYDRRIERVEQSKLITADFYSAPISRDRIKWHTQGLEMTASAKIVFLDPDNGLETEKMYESGRCGAEYGARKELLAYYQRGQSVILYQHRPQMMKKEECIRRVLAFEGTTLKANTVRILEFPKYTNRFYFMFLHERDLAAAEHICLDMGTNWRGFCNLISTDESQGL